MGEVGALAAGGPVCSCGLPPRAKAQRLARSRLVARLSVAPAGV